MATRYRTPACREAICALLRSGDPYVVEQEVTTGAVTSKFYRVDCDDLVGEVSVDDQLPNGLGVGEFQSLMALAGLGDKGAQQALSSGGFGAEAH